MNRSGFTTIEVIIASALIVTLITSGAIGMRQMNLLNQMAATRTSHTEMRARVLSALSNSGTCGKQLILNPPGVVAYPTAGPPTTFPITLDQILDEQLLHPILVRDAPAPDGMSYKMDLWFPSSIPEAVNLPIGLGRVAATDRYAVQLEIRGVRDNLKVMGGAPGDVVGRIPLFAEFDSLTRRLVSCTIHPEDIDEGKLFGGSHTVRQCLEHDGTPMMTEQGLICRIPVLTGPNGSTIPDCSSVADPTWFNVESGGKHYNTTRRVEMPFQGCHGTFTDVTGWHSMSPTDVESRSVTIKKGTKNSLWLLLAGAAFVTLVVGPMAPALAVALATAMVIVWYILNLFKKCKTEGFTFYAVVNGVGCR